jgi:hypothetical protein
LSDHAPPGLAAVAAAGAACSVTVGLVERGAASFAAPLRPYLGDVTLIGSGFSFLRSLVTDLPIYSPAVRSHPPGFLLGLWILDWAHLKGSGWAAAVVIAGGALIAVAAAIASTPRWVIPIAVVVPALLWPAPEPTAFFVGVTALAVVLLLRATTWPVTLAGGLLAGAALLLIYEALVPIVVALAVLLYRRRADLAAAATAGTVAPLLVLRSAGFSWLAGLRAHW